MSKNEKLVLKLLSKPKDFTYSELVKLLKYFGYEEVPRGKTAGSRRAFVHFATQNIIRLHKPHPGTILKGYQVEYVIESLKKEGLL